MTDANAAAQPTPERRQVPESQDDTVKDLAECRPPSKSKS